MTRPRACKRNNVKRSSAEKEKKTFSRFVSTKLRVVFPSFLVSSLLFLPQFIPAAQATTPRTPPPSTASGTGTFSTSVTAKTAIPMDTVAFGNGLAALREIASEIAAEVTSPTAAALSPGSILL